MLTVRIQEKNHSESIMVLKLKDGSKAERCKADQLIAYDHEGGAIASDAAAPFFKLSSKGLDRKAHIC